MRILNDGQPSEGPVYALVIQSCFKGSSWYSRKLRSRVCPCCNIHIHRNNHLAMAARSKLQLRRVDTSETMPDRGSVEKRCKSRI